MVRNQMITRFVVQNDPCFLRTSPFFHPPSAGGAPTTETTFSAAPLLILLWLSSTGWSSLETGAGPFTLQSFQRQAISVILDPYDPHPRTLKFTPLSQLLSTFNFVYSAAYLTYLLHYLTYMSKTKFTILLPSPQSRQVNKWNNNNNKKKSKTRAPSLLPTLGKTTLLSTCAQSQNLGSPSWQTVFPISRSPLLVSLITKLN